MANSQSEEDGKKLSQLFDDLFELCNLLQTTNESTSSYNIQKKLHIGLEGGKKAIDMVNQLELFSSNEEIDEVASNEMRYLLLPALMGYLTVQSTKGDRLDNVTKSQVFYVDYLKLCNNYGLTNVAIPEVAGLEEEGEAIEDKEKQVALSRPSAGPSPADMRVMGGQRATKIERFKEQKEYAAKLKELYEHVQKEHVDDEIKREYYTTLLKKWVNSALDELDSISMELNILEHMAKMKADNVEAAAALGVKTAEPKMPEKSNYTFRPFILTKGDLQKSVYGAGYPGLPTYTIEEFYEQRVKDGVFPSHSHVQSQSLLEKACMNHDAQLQQQDEEERQKDTKSEKDDQIDLKAAREWDDWKDDHRRGWGNTQNKG